MRFRRRTRAVLALSVVVVLSATVGTGCGSVAEAVGDATALDRSAGAGLPSESPATDGADVGAAALTTAPLTTTPLAASSSIAPAPDVAPGSTSPSSDSFSAPPGFEEAIAAAILAEDTVGLTALEAGCVSRSLVGDLGVGGLTDLAGEAAGAPTLTDLTERERIVLADAMIGCIDLRRLLLQELDGQLPLTAPTLECVTDDLLADGALGALMREAIIAGDGTVADDSSLTAPMLTALTRCMTAQDLRQLAEPG